MKVILDFPPLKIDISKWSRISHGHNGYHKASRWWTSKLSRYWWWSYNRSSQGCFQDHQWGQKGTFYVTMLHYCLEKMIRNYKRFFLCGWASTKTFLSGVGWSAALVKQIKDKLPKRVSNDPPNLVYFRTRTVYHYPLIPGVFLKAKETKGFREPRSALWTRELLILQ